MIQEHKLLLESILNHEVYKEMSSKLKQSTHLDDNMDYEWSWLQLHGGSQVDAYKLINTDYDTMRQRQKGAVGNLFVGDTEDWNRYSNTVKKLLSEGLELTRVKNERIDRTYRQLIDEVYRVDKEYNKKIDSFKSFCHKYT